MSFDVYSRRFELAYVPDGGTGAATEVAVPYGIHYGKGRRYRVDHSAGVDVEREEDAHQFLDLLKVTKNKEWRSGEEVFLRIEPI